jgi:hypothetical protein
MGETENPEATKLEFVKSIANKAHDVFSTFISNNVPNEGLSSYIEVYGPMNEFLMECEKIESDLGAGNALDVTKDTLNGLEERANKLIVDLKTYVGDFEV